MLVSRTNKNTGSGGGSGPPLSDAIPLPLGTPAAGSSGAASRADHIHRLPSAEDVGALAATALSDAIPAPLGVAAAGSSSAVPRADHKHAMPTATQVGAVPASGGSFTGGVTFGSGLTSNGTTTINSALMVDGDFAHQSGNASFEGETAFKGLVEFESNNVQLNNGHLLTTGASLTEFHGDLWVYNDLHFGLSSGLLGMWLSGTTPTQRTMARLTTTGDLHLGHVDGANVHFGGVIAQRKPVSASYTAQRTDQMIAVTDTSASRTITLPSPEKGLYILVVDESGGASGTPIKIKAALGNISGVAEVLIDVKYGARTFYASDTAWFVLGGP